MSKPSKKDNKFTLSLPRIVIRANSNDTEYNLNQN